MQLYLLVWRRSFDFSGRSSKHEFWWFFLVHLIVTLLCIWGDIVMGLWLDTIYSVTSIIPMLSAIARRLHDSGKSGYWGFVFLVPIVGPFWLVYLLVQPSSERFSKEAVV